MASQKNKSSKKLKKGDSTVPRGKFYYNKRIAIVKPSPMPLERGLRAKELKEWSTPKKENSLPFERQLQRRIPLKVPTPCTKS